eukprot:COSAG01_NODE_32943_length_572_cov_30.264271_1_plen_25_part_01
MGAGAAAAGVAALTRPRQSSGGAS